MSTAAILRDVQDAGEDFEWYPTTDTILDDLASYIKSRRGGELRSTISILDVGAGDGRVLKGLEDRLYRGRHGHSGGSADLYAIEKSDVLCTHLARKNIFLLGSDATLESFYRKNMDIVFCNPPYSEYEEWAVKLIRQCPSASELYLVVPSRAEDSELVHSTLRARGAEMHVVCRSDFHNAERKARCRVSILHVKYPEDARGALDLAFADTFPDIHDWVEEAVKERAQKKQDSARDLEEQSGTTGIKAKGDLVDNLVESYQEQYERLLTEYRKVTSLDYSVLLLVSADIEHIQNNLFNQINKLHHHYWELLLRELTVLRDNLTSEQIHNLTERLHATAQVDFTRPNILRVITCVLENIQQDLQSNMVRVYERLMYSACIHSYKSNAKLFKENKFRYLNDIRQEEELPFHLDYRMVLTHMAEANSQGKLSLSYHGRDMLHDLWMVARQYGFSSDPTREHHEPAFLAASGWYQARMSTGSKNYRKAMWGGEEVTLLEVKPFLNQNVHLKLNQEFMLRLNIDYGIHKGWLHSAEQAAKELDDPRAAEMFDEVNTKRTQLGVFKVLTLGFGS